VDPVTAAPAPAPVPVVPALDLDAVTADLVAVEAALERLDEGTYGRCLACDAPIDDEALAASPTQATCTAHLAV
jgi:RNA polymerase-binding transcription factor DksA